MGVSVGATDAAAAVDAAAVAAAVDAAANNSWYYIPDG